jgi:uridine kinase
LNAMSKKWMQAIEKYSVDEAIPPPREGNNPLSPKWPFRMLVNGPSGCGKTTFVLSLIFEHLKHDRIYIFCRDTTEDKYNALVKMDQEMMDNIKLQVKKKKLDPNMITPSVLLTNDLSKLKIDDMDPKEQHLIIIDDMTNERDQSIIEDAFIRCRKRNASIIYLSHNFHKVPKTIRLNANYIACYSCNNRKEIRLLAETLATAVDKDKFVEIFNEATKDKHSFLFLDNSLFTTNEMLRIRRNLDECLC